MALALDARAARARQRMAESGGRCGCGEGRHCGRAAAGPSRAGGRMPRSRRCAGQARRRAARRSTRRSSRARITARRRPASTPSWRPAFARVVSALEDPNPQIAGRGARAAARAGRRGRCRCWRRGGAARACGAFPPRARRPPACDAEARRLGGRQGRTAGPQARGDHRRGGARARAPDARDERCGADRHRHGAVGRSAA